MRWISTRAGRRSGSPTRRAPLITGRMLVGILLCLCVPFLPGRLVASGIEVTVQTTDCAGNVGFSSFDSRALYKIQAGDCKDPATGRPLQQILLQSRDAVVQYNVLWVTEEEAGSVMQQIRSIGDARLERLTGPEVKIDSRTVIKQETVPAPQSAPSSATPAPRSDDSPGPEINLLDPPISGTRSITRVITPDKADTRLLVGRIEAPAGLLSLTVNGQPQTVDERGLFRVEVPLQSDDTPVKLLAVDLQGKQDELEFYLLPQAAVSAAMGDAEEAPDMFGDYHALIIANNQYAKLDDLNTPVNDADALAELLEQRYGFKVMRLNNATRYDVLSALNELRRELTEQDNLLVYYAGHGEYDKVNNRGHWLPVDAERESTANWISTVAITDTVNAMSAKHVLIIADSCYSGALTRGTNTDLDPNLSPDLRQRWLATIAKSRSRYVMTSGGVKPVLDDGGNGHSVFANALLMALQQHDGVIESSTLFQDISDRVRQRAEELQIDTVPQYAQLKNTGHEYGEFLLVARP